MITSLHLTNYRGFERYELNGLAQVNLIVGKNNSGKTSLLEAFQIVEANSLDAVYRSLRTTALNRGEVVLVEDESEISRKKSTVPCFRHFFHQRQFLSDPNAHVVVNADDEKIIDFAVDYRYNASIPGPINLFSDELVMTIKNEKSDQLYMPINSEGGLVGELRATQRKGNSKERPQLNKPFGPQMPRFLRTESLSSTELIEPWNDIIQSGQETEVIAAMQLLDPEISSIAFLANYGFFEFGPASGILVGRNGTRERFPLGSDGEGMRRLLALSIALINTRQGSLLIDEIDTGLHHSTLADMWHMVVETAVRSKIQVFATTHSYDCMKGLAQLCLDRPDLAECVALSKINRLDETSTAFMGSELPDLINESIEVR